MGGYLAAFEIVTRLKDRIRPALAYIFLCKEQFMLKKSIFLFFALLMVGLTVVPQVQAQTKQQQQELEQIAKRSMNGLSPQDRQRVVQIMTDVFVAQGMSRQQAAALAETSADSMFSRDVGQMSAAERRKFEEQQRSIEELEQRQQQQSQIEAKTYEGATTGWPPASAFQRAGFNMAQPNLKTKNGVTYSYIIAGDNEDLTIYLYNNHLWTTLPPGFSNAEQKTVKQHIEKAAGKKFDKSDFISIPDPQNKNAYTRIRVEDKGHFLVITIIPPNAGAGGKG
jgi:hypothetical protein